MTLKKYQPIVVAIILVLVASLYSCKRTNNVVNNKKSNSTLSLCDSLESQGTNRVLCESWSNNKGIKKAILFSKTRTNSKEEFFAEIFTEKRFNSPLVKVYDFIEDCPVDFSINFIKNSFSVTDINNNGIKEVSFLYEIACQGGIGPIKMKLILIEGHKKYVIRGFRLDDVSIKNNETPNYPNSVIDEKFINAPHNFLDFSSKKWIQYHGTRLSNFDKGNKYSIKKVSIINSDIVLHLSNNQNKKFNIPYFLEDENPQISMKNNKIVLYYGDHYGNSIESTWSYFSKQNNLFLESLIGKFPIKNKEKNNLKICKINGLNINVKKIDVEKVYDLLQKSENCIYQTM